MRVAKARSLLILISLAAALCNDGRTENSLVVWGEGEGITNVPEVENPLAIAAGPEHGVVLKGDGTLARWGGKTGYVGVVPAEATNVAAIAAGLEHCVAARLDGSVFCWGRNHHGQRVPPSGLSGVVAVAAGDSFSVALKGDGSVVCWGEWFVNGGYEVPTNGLTGVKGISAAEDQLLVLREDGSVGLYGRVDEGDVEFANSLTGMKGVSAGPSFFLALRGDGSIVAWGPQAPGGVPTGNGFVGVSAGGLGHGLALGTNGVWGWGRINSEGVIVPAELRDGRRVLGIGAGHAYCAAIVEGCAAPVLGSIEVWPSEVVCAGTVARLSQPVAGEPEGLSYQWLKNGSVMEGATGSVLELTPVSSQDVYACRVRSECGLEGTSGGVGFGVVAAPVAVDRVYYRAAGASCKIPVSDLTLEGSLHGVGASAEGASVSFGFDFISYVPVPGNNRSDSFSYTLSNGYCLGTGTISVVVTNSAGSVGIDCADGVVSVVFHGVPGEGYRVERCADARFGPELTSTVLVTNAPEGGAFVYREAVGEGGFFRVGQ